MELELTVISSNEHSPPPFAWEQWYNLAGGRTISIPAADHWLKKIFTEQVPRFNDPVADTYQGFDTPAEASSWIKEIARLHGADIVGITVIEPQDIYSGRSVEERYAIVLGKKMIYEEFVQVPSESAAVECLRIYHELGETVLHLADAMRARGIACRVEHPIGDSSVLHVPLALKAGFGELGRHGSIINPTYGPLFRIGSILTNLPLALDSPINVGIGAFCDTCKACRIFCPADAIPDERSPEFGTDPQGNARYVVDTGKCFPYFATANYCSACLATCAYKHKEWAKMHDETTGPFPTVPFGTVPPPIVQEPDGGASHTFPKIRREEKSPYHRVR